MSWTVREYRPEDHEAVLALADRLGIGAAPWRDPVRWREVSRGWVEGSVRRTGTEGRAYVAVTGDGTVAGFVSVATKEHFTGDLDAYVGELAVTEAAEGGGAGRALMAAAEGWARERGLDRITLDTGAANIRARAFYGRLGFADEGVQLTKLL